MLDGNGDSDGLPVCRRAVSLVAVLRTAHPGHADLDLAREALALRIDHRKTDLLEEHPRSLVAAEAELLAELASRDPGIERGGQVHRPEPGDEWQARPVEDRSSGQRRLQPACRALPEATLHQLVGSRRPAGRADEPCRPASAREVAHARGVIGKIALELEQAARWVGWLLEHSPTLLEDVG